MPASPREQIFRSDDLASATRRARTVQGHRALLTFPWQSAANGTALSSTYCPTWQLVITLAFNDLL